MEATATLSFWVGGGTPASTAVLLVLVRLSAESHRRATLWFPERPLIRHFKFFSFNTYSLSTFKVLDTLRGAGETVVEKVRLLPRLCFQQGHVQNRVTVCFHKPSRVVFSFEKDTVGLGYLYCNCICASGSPFCWDSGAKLEWPCLVFHASPK